MLPYLRIRGTPEYWAVLDQQVAAALGTRKTAQEALDDTAAAWEEITDRLGREQQLKSYEEAITAGLTSPRMALVNGRTMPCTPRCHSEASGSWK